MCAKKRINNPRIMKLMVAEQVFCLGVSFLFCGFLRVSRGDGRERERERKRKRKSGLLLM